MPNWVLTLLVSLLSFAVPAQAVSPAITKAHATTHRIMIEGIKERTGFCSSTAIGPHALLTATHCLRPMTHLIVDGKDCVVDEIYGDTLDHTIFLLSDIEFKDYAEFADCPALEQGDSIFVFGNPGKFPDMFRLGYVAGFDEAGEEKASADSFKNLFLDAPVRPIPTKYSVITYYDMNGFFGDSGSGIFNMAGKIVGVISFIDGDDHEAFSQKYMGSMRMKLSKDMIERARNYKGDK